MGVKDLYKISAEVTPKAYKGALPKVIHNSGANVIIIDLSCYAYSYACTNNRHYGRHNYSYAGVLWTKDQVYYLAKRIVRMIEGVQINYPESHIFIIADGQAPNVKKRLTRYNSNQVTYQLDLINAITTGAEFTKWMWPYTKHPSNKQLDYAAVAKLAEMYTSVTDRLKYAVDTSATKLAEMSTSLADRLKYPHLNQDIDMGSSRIGYLTKEKTAILNAMKKFATYGANYAQLNAWTKHHLCAIDKKTSDCILRNLGNKFPFPKIETFECIFSLIRNNYKCWGTKMWTLIQAPSEADFVIADLSWEVKSQGFQPIIYSHDSDMMIIATGIQVRNETVACKTGKSKRTIRTYCNIDEVWDRLYNLFTNGKPVRDLVSSRDVIGRILRVIFKVSGTDYHWGTKGLGKGAAIKRLNNAYDEITPIPKVIIRLWGEYINLRAKCEQQRASR